MGMETLAKFCAEVPRPDPVIDTHHLVRDNGAAEVKMSITLFAKTVIPFATLMLVSLACTLGASAPAPTANSSDTNSPGTTPSPIAVEPTQTPTQTPTPTPTPSPTPLPAVRLSEADRFIHNGDYASAIAEYQAVLSGGSGDELEEAQFKLGQAALRQNDLLIAENALTQYIAAYPDSPRLADAWFLLGDTRFISGNPTGAVDAYRAYLARRGDTIESYVQERIGDAFDQAGDDNAAIEAYRRAIVLAPNTSIAAGQREKLALTYRLNGDFAAAIEQYRAILSFAQMPAYRAHVSLLYGQTLIDSGDAAGYDAFLDLVNDYPRTGDAYEALVALINAGVELDAFQRGMVDYYAGQYDAAVVAFDSAIRAGERLDEARYYAGLSHRAAGNLTAAIVQFDAIIRNHLNSEFWGQAWIDKAIAQSLGGETEAAVETLTTFAGDYPGATLAPNALLRAGLLLERSGEYARAAETYRQMQAAYPFAEGASNALFAAGMDAYRSGDTKAALESWRVLSDTYPAAEFYPAALLWQSKLIPDAAGEESPETLLTIAAQVAPLSYYGIRAAELRDRRPTLGAMPYHLAFDEQADRAEAESWLIGWAGSESASPPGELPQSIRDDARYQRAVELWRLGWIDHAEDEFESLRNAYKDDPLALYVLSLHWRDIGLYRSSLMAAARLIAISPAQTPDRAPAFIARLAYPVYYADLITGEAEAYNLDPLLLFSLVRQESLFESVALSSASANGLMQVIPSTGREIATALGWPNYTAAELNKPYVSIAFGAYYLARQRDLFDGDLYVALAAYNGGPGNAARWRDAARGDPDLLLETITLNETRTYLIRIREHLAMYQRLYGDTAGKLPQP